jgi:hypothetical protein
MFNKKRAKVEKNWENSWWEKNIFVLLRKMSNFAAQKCREKTLFSRQKME